MTLGRPKWKIINPVIQKKKKKEEQQKQYIPLNCDNETNPPTFKNEVPCAPQLQRSISRERARE